MVIEAERYRSKRYKNDVLTDLQIVSPGDWTGMDFFRGKIKIAIINSIGGNKGSIFVKGNTKRIRAVIYEDQYDEEGKQINIFDNHPITITGEQTLSLETIKGKSKQVADIYLKY
jgi:hypothetical protein